MADELSSVDKTSEVDGFQLNSGWKPPQEDKKHNNFAEIFGNLNDMSNTSTLFDGIDDDMPPSNDGGNHVSPSNLNSKILFLDNYLYYSYRQ